MGAKGVRIIRPMRYQIIIDAIMMDLFHRMLLMDIEKIYSYDHEFISLACLATTMPPTGMQRSTLTTLGFQLIISFSARAVVSK